LSVSKPAPSFTVTAASDRVTLDDSGAARASFTVTNTSPQTLRGRLLTRPTDPAKPGWFSIAGESIRDFNPNAAEQVVVQLSVQPPAPPGSYSFRLDAVSEVDPDEDFTEGPSVALDIAAPPPPKKKFPWWILVIVGAVVLLVIIGVVVFLLTRGDGGETLSPVPPVTGQSEPEAERVLAGAGFNVAVAQVAVRSPALDGLVLSQEPPAQTQSPAGTVVTIRVGRFVGRPPPPFRTTPPPPPSQ
jgi:PASTA domain-containing protein